MISGFKKITFLLPFALSSCFRFVDPPQYTQYRPILLTRESLEKSISFHQADKISSPAKIYYKDNYIFISERYKGVHIIDNSNPAQPLNKGYISVPGCIDMAIKGNTLYVDNATYLVALNIGNISGSKVEVQKQIKDAFPELAPPDGRLIPEKYDIRNRPANTVIVEWIK